MITPEIFGQGMGLLAERYNRDVSADLAGVYFEQLNAELDDDGFIRAVKLHIRAGSFYPTIDELLTAGGAGAAAGEAGRLFTAIAASPSYHPTAGSYYDLAAIERRHGTAAARALQTIGGVERLRRMDPRDRPFALKEYVAAYEDLIRASRHERLTPLLTGARAPSLPPFIDRRLGPG